MAISIHSRPGRSHLQYVFIGATVFAAFVAVIPIAAAIVSGAGVSGAAKTAFATAPSGNYAVVARPEDDFDVVAVAPAGGGEPVEVARVPHLRGFTASGSVSPDGRQLALVTVNGGSPTRPEASLLVLDLESGSTKHLANAVSPLQTALWSPDSRSLVVTRELDAAKARPDVRFLRVSLNDGAAVELFDVRAPLGAYAIGFDSGGALFTVTIDGSGSRLGRNGAAGAQLSKQITRDWRLSPDSSRIAFVEVNLENGLRYLARTVNVDGSETRGVEAQSASASPAGQELGTAWKPGAASATFGREPADYARSSEIGGVQAQAQSVPGFDVPLEYAPDGSVLSVTHWTGSSFRQSGVPTLQLVADSHRVDVPNFTRFFGWAAR
ncbi:MAG: hypothetical protein ABI939_04980 [Anaerolineaceae bacterium]